MIFSVSHNGINSNHVWRHKKKRVKKRIPLSKWKHGKHGRLKAGWKAQNMWREEKETMKQWVERSSTTG